MEMGKCSVWYMWMPYCLGGSQEVVEQVKWGAAVTVLSASTRGVCRKNVRGNTTAGKVATMNACANSRHLQNSWKSCLWALFCHLGGGCQSQTGFEQQNIHQVKFWYWGISKFLNLNVLTAILGPPKNWRLIWKLWNLRSPTLGSKIWRSGIRGTDPDPAIHPAGEMWSKNAFEDILPSWRLVGLISIFLIRIVNCRRFVTRRLLDHTRCGWRRWWCWWWRWSSRLRGGGGDYCPRCGWAS